MHRRSAHYKWIALSNTTLGVLMAAINGTILIIALPVIFSGIQVNPLAPGQSSLLLWVMLGFNVATTVLLVMFGRMSDIFGRVRLYNIGFAIFTIGSILCSVTWSKGMAGEIELILFRIIQGIGGAFLFSNSSAILTDAFPKDQRGLALGLNQIAAIGGSVIGLVLGGLLAATGQWRMIFLVNVPIGIIGTIWAYVALKEVGQRVTDARIDYIGNIALGVGITGIMLGLTYGIMPYGHSAMGWGSPFVIISLIVGFLALVVFVIVENKVQSPMFSMHLFTIRAFSAGNFSAFLASLARGGLQFMLIIWLQGIWLPLHGVSYANTPLQAGIDTLPQTFGFLLAGPLSGYLSDRYGVRMFATIGMVITAIGFWLLGTLPVDFSFWPFAIDLLIVGFGLGLFASPNSAGVMNSVPSRFRGVASGMLSTFNNAGMMMSLGVFFSIVIAVLSQTLPQAITKGLLLQHLPAVVVAKVAALPPTSSLFAALLGFNPLSQLLPAPVLAALPKHNRAVILSQHFFPSLIGTPFMHGLSTAFMISLLLSAIAAVSSWLRGKSQSIEE